MTARNQACAVGEELTAKELEVLGLLATRLSRREIGQRLYVSLNTVKTHQRALYRKLGVEDREHGGHPRPRARPALADPATPRPIQADPTSSRGSPPNVLRFVTCRGRAYGRIPKAVATQSPG